MRAAKPRDYQFARQAGQQICLHCRQTRNVLRMMDGVDGGTRPLLCLSQRLTEALLAAKPHRKKAVRLFVLEQTMKNQSALSGVK